MSLLSSRTELLTALFEASIAASLDPSHWQPLCDQIAESYESAAFMVYAYDMQHSRSPEFYGSRACWAELSELREELQNGETDDDKVAYSFFSRAKSGLLFSEAQFLGLPFGAKLPRSHHREAVLEATGAKERFAMRLNEIGPFLDIAAFHTWTQGMHIYERLRADTPIFSRLLSKTVEASRMIKALSSSYDLLCNLFDKLNFAVCFCDSQSKVIQGNTCFWELAGQRRCIIVSDSRILGCDVGASARIAGCVTAATSGESRQSLLSTSLAHKDSESSLILQTIAIKDRQVAYDARVAMVIILDPKDEARLNVDGLESFGVLSAAEIEVCRLLIRGYSTDQIAERRSSSVNTVRTQIKSVQAKLSCQSRLDVQRLALVSSSPIKNPDHTPDG
ncbi:MAG: LuxR C-terminal-related transcriptional regulator [Pseudomonadota bacterium]